MEREISIALGIVVAREKRDNPWIKWAWRPIDLLIGVPPAEPWTELGCSGDNTHFHADTKLLTLYRSDTEAYRMNLSAATPSVYVVMREIEDGRDDGGFPLYVHSITASPYEAQDYLDSGEDIVEQVPMPEALIAWVEQFIEAHHVNEPFKKRKRQPIKKEEHLFGKEPIFVSRSRPPEEEGGHDG